LIVKQILYRPKDELTSDGSKMLSKIQDFYQQVLSLICNLLRKWNESYIICFKILKNCRLFLHKNYHVNCSNKCLCARFL